MITTVSSSAALATALKSAHGGDTILLAAGSYSALSLSGLNFASAVTIKSADTAHEAVINGLTLNNVSGLSFSSLAFATNGGTAVSLYSSNTLSFDSVQLFGLNNGNAMMIRDSFGVSVTNSDVGKLSTGINELNVHDINISNNTFHDIASGDIRGAGASVETISGNHFLNAKATVADHSDVISLWQDNTANHVTIANNTFGPTVSQPVVTTPPPVVTAPVVTSPPPTTGPVTVSSSAALATALKSAHAGDTILLASGTYSAVNLSGLHFSSAVTIQSADSAHEAVINGLTINSSSGLAFNHLDFASNGGTAVSVYSSQNVTFDSISEHGTALGDGSGMMIRDSSGVSLTNSDVGKLGTGVNELSSTNVTITGNTFHDISSGAIRGTGTTNETISGNTFVDANTSIANHSDVIQLWQDNTANHVTIADNTFGAAATSPVVSAPIVSQPVISSPSSVTSSPAPSVGATVTVTTSDGLWAALKAAHNGDTILLAPGTYAPIQLNLFTFDGTVTVQSADNAHQAVLTGLKIMNSSGIAFNNVDVPVATAATQGVAVMSSTNISFSGLTVHGTGAAPQGLGMMVQNSVGVTVTDSTFSGVGTGIGHSLSSNLTIADNTFHNIQTDGISGGGATHVVIEGNEFDTFHPAVGDHPDAIQFFGYNGTSSSDITITDNVISRGAGDPIQGIFTESTNNITITGNAMSGTMYNGISLSGTHGGLIENNFVQGYSDMNTWIIVRGQSDGVTVDHNTAQAVLNYVDNGIANTNYLASANAIIPGAAVGDVSAMNTWLAQHAPLTLTGAATGTLTGGPGDDLLISNGGANIMTGGLGNDTFAFAKLPSGTAQITDFTHGQDTLDLHSLLTSYTGSDPVADHWVKFASDSTGTTVFVDTDGPSGGAGFVAVAKLAGVTSVASSDWIFH